MVVPAGWEGSHRKEESKAMCWWLWLALPGGAWPFDFAWDYILCPGLAHNACTVKSSLVVGDSLCDITLPVVEDGISEVQGQPSLQETFQKTQDPIHPTKQETTSLPVNDRLSLNGGFRTQDQNGIRFSVVQNLPFRTPWHRTVSGMKASGLDLSVHTLRHSWQAISKC